MGKSDNLALVDRQIWTCGESECGCPIIEEDCQDLQKAREPFSEIATVKFHPRHSKTEVWARKREASIGSEAIVESRILRTDECSPIKAYDIPSRNLIGAPRSPYLVTQESRWILLV